GARGVARACGTRDPHPHRAQLDVLQRTAMRLKLTLERANGQPRTDVLVTVDTTVSVGDVARAIARRDPLGASSAAASVTLELRDREARVLAPSISVADAGLRSGHTIRLADATHASEAREQREQLATVVVVSGADAGQEFALPRGVTQIGRERGNDIR